MENERSTAPPCTTPERIFKAGKEPTGVRVTPYHKPFGIKQILNSLEPEEIEKIRASPFGKFVELADKPSFSGRFGRYIISRQLKVSCYSIQLKYLKPHIINSLHGIPNRSTHHLNRLPSPFYYISYRWVVCRKAKRIVVAAWHSLNVGRITRITQKLVK
ncbi:hypothetical protein YC2023_072717 [Brassica napus]